jgi:hypothetical protein
MSGASALRVIAVSTTAAWSTADVQCSTRRWDRIRGTDHAPDARRDLTPDEPASDHREGALRHRGTQAARVLDGAHDVHARPLALAGQ